MSSPSIILSHLSWTTPDGRAVLTDLNLRFQRERCGIIGRNGIGKSTILRLISGDLTPHSGAITVNGSAAMLRQMVQIGAREEIADLFGARSDLALLQRAERGDASAEEIADADWTLATRIESALARAGLPLGPDTPLARLSGGERTRAAIAAAIFAAPDFLLLDEPTNNLDRDGRAAVLGFLAEWRGGALVVSHDRELLAGMDCLVELSTTGVRRYGGGWKDYCDRKQLEQAAAEARLVDAEKESARIARQVQAVRERQDRRDSAGRRKAGKADMPKVLLGAMKRRAEETRGAASRIAERLSAEAQAQRAAARSAIEIIDPLHVSLPPSGLAEGTTVLEFADVTAGHAASEPVLRNLSLQIVGPERIALCGPNGSGKSTLIALIAGTLEPIDGRVRAHVPFALLDQRAAILDPGLSIADNFCRLNPGGTNNQCRAALARFRFRAGAADQLAGTLSGGQLLRAGLACTLGASRPPQLLILDEPANHLDIEALAAVEAGLAAFDGALLIVSHDEEFLNAIGITRRILLGRDQSVLTSPGAAR